ncbi:hypothetical protein PUNSTDRAFT_130387 [Punctularia strigosozonata HHB-11173 SS5]|uniref:uncharacterized protein n=1 Tax=Punctularia strigosozonata (strain HHB-11173) TaxID=741275 RepID=UPI00044172B7|nr:uncharacterized protein PUNSTDRAFT_130387 [Punctularia strigosozonata HHB-11173 SS5]EIN12114.1 hypothetical protein PUNSTDRAFT_130387 [Punctularia strigosozonata HHB-11173 SS5]
MSKNPADPLNPRTQDPEDVDKAALIRQLVARHGPGYLELLIEHAKAGKLGGSSSGEGHRTDDVREMEIDADPSPPPPNQQARRGRSSASVDQRVAQSARTATTSRAQDGQQPRSISTTAAATRKSSRQTSKARPAGQADRNPSERDGPRPPAAPSAQGPTPADPRDRQRSTPVAPVPASPIAPIDAQDHSADTASPTAVATSHQLAALASTLTRSVNDVSARLSAIETIPAQLSAQKQFADAVLKAHAEQAADHANVTDTVDHITRDITKLSVMQQVLFHMCHEQAEKLQTLAAEVAKLNDNLAQIRQSADRLR